MIAVVCLSPLIRYALCRHYLSEGLSDYDAGDATYRNVLSHMDAFFMGGLIPMLALDKRVRKPGWWFLGAALVALGAGFANYLHSPRVFAFPFELGYPQSLIINDLHVWGYTCVDAFFAFGLLAVVSPYRPTAMDASTGLLSGPWLVRIGQVSYGMYVVNLAVWMYFFEPFVRARGAGIPLLMAVFIPYLLIVWGLAEVSYRFYEVKFIRLKDKLFPGGGAAEIKATAKTDERMTAERMTAERTKPRI